MKKNENKELSLRGAEGDVAISCDKALSSRGRAESSDVVISCDKVLMNIRNHYCMSHLLSEIATSAFRLLVMTIPTLILAAVLAMGLISGSRAEVTCDYNAETKKLTISGSGVFEQSTFNNCTGDYLDAGHMGFFLADIDIGPNITGLGDMVFSSLYNNGEFTTAIHFAENSKLTSIGNGAFSGATNLTAIAIPDSVTNIGDYAFSGADRKSVV